MAKFRDECIDLDSLYEAVMSGERLSMDERQIILSALGLWTMCSEADRSSIAERWIARSSGDQMTSSTARH